MPLSRYQIRNEYSLADAELYKSADRDDPEAILEGVAMAGLVGILRQLGDLTEFAAEIFSSLHEEVMATHARGHTLMLRVQQLEEEMPLLEKSIFSQTSYTQFIENGGIDWHAKAEVDQNLITTGDMPRFIMDSYEECRGPPQLFMLDRFDVAGTGACLKRYTDPSFFKSQLAASGKEKDLEREKLSQKTKRKGLHQQKGQQKGGDYLSASEFCLKLSNMIPDEPDNHEHDITHGAKIKRKHLNGLPFSLKAERTYMERFCETYSKQDSRLCCSIDAKKKTGEMGFEVHEFRHRKQKPFDRKLGSKVKSRTSLKDLLTEPEPEKIIHTAPDVWQKDVTIDVNSVMEHVHETEHYVDALTTLGSGEETDSNSKFKHANEILKTGHGLKFDTVHKHLDMQAQVSDPRSSGDSFDWNTSNMEHRSQYSSFDTHSKGEASVTSEIYPNIVCSPSSDNISVNETILQTKVSTFQMANSTADGKSVVSSVVDVVDSSSSSCVTNSMPNMDHVNSRIDLLEVQSGDTDDRFMGKSQNLDDSLEQFQGMPGKKYQEFSDANDSPLLPKEKSARTINKLPGNYRNTVDHADISELPSGYGYQSINARDPPAFMQDELVTEKIGHNSSSSRDDESESFVKVVSDISSLPWRTRSVQPFNEHGIIPVNHLCSANESIGDSANASWGVDTNLLPWKKHSLSFFSEHSDIVASEPTLTADHIIPDNNVYSVNEVIDESTSASQIVEIGDSLSAGVDNSGFDPVHVESSPQKPSALSVAGGMLDQADSGTNASVACLRSDAKSSNSGVGNGTLEPDSADGPEASSLELQGHGIQSKAMHSNQDPFELDVRMEELANHAVPSYHYHQNRQECYSREFESSLSTSVIGKVGRPNDSCDGPVFLEYGLEFISIPQVGCCSDDTANGKLVMNASSLDVSICQTTEIGEKVTKSQDSSTTKQDIGGPLIKDPPSNIQFLGSAWNSALSEITDPVFQAPRVLETTEVRHEKAEVDIPASDIIVAEPRADFGDLHSDQFLLGSVADCHAFSHLPVKSEGMMLENMVDLPVDEAVTLNELNDKGKGNQSLSIENGQKGLQLDPYSTRDASPEKVVTAYTEMNGEADIDKSLLVTKMDVELDQYSDPESHLGRPNNGFDNAVTDGTEVMTEQSQHHKLTLEPVLPKSDFDSKYCSYLDLSEVGSDAQGALATPLVGSKHEDDSAGLRPIQSGFFLEVGNSSSEPEGSRLNVRAQPDNYSHHPAASESFEPKLCFANNAKIIVSRASGPEACINTGDYYESENCENHLLQTHDASAKGSSCEAGIACIEIINPVSEIDTPAYSTESISYRGSESVYSVGNSSLAVIQGEENEGEQAQSAEVHWYLLDNTDICEDRRGELRMAGGEASHHGHGREDTSCWPICFNEEDAGLPVREGEGEKQTNPQLEKEELTPQSGNDVRFQQSHRVSKTKDDGVNDLHSLVELKCSSNPLGELQQCIPGTSNAWKQLDSHQIEDSIPLRGDFHVESDNHPIQAPGSVGNHVHNEDEPEKAQSVEQNNPDMSQLEYTAQILDLGAGSSGLQQSNVFDSSIRMTIGLNEYLAQKQLVSHKMEVSLYSQTHFQLESGFHPVEGFKDDWVHDRNQLERTEVMTKDDLGTSWAEHGYQKLEEQQISGAGSSEKACDFHLDCHGGTANMLDGLHPSEPASLAAHNMPPNHNLDSIEPKSQLLTSPSSGLSPAERNLFLPSNLDEMPPLPPLPPLQWRVKKPQEQSDTYGNVVLSFKSLQQLPSASCDGTINSATDIEGGSFQSAGRLLIPSNSNNLASSSCTSDTIDREENELPGISPSARHLPVPSTSNGLASSSSTSDAIHKEENEPPGKSPSEEHLPIPSNGDELASSSCISDTIHREEIELPSESSPPSTLEGESKSDGSPADVESMSAMEVHVDTRKLSGKTKHPKPKDPLIEAVAAHDKSKLRKVAERLLPELGPKIDARSSWLNQIKSKSSSLRPAIPPRPIIQGPQTNLKVVAILEKVRAIRQAHAGSDEDADSWSDSEP